MDFLKRALVDWVDAVDMEKTELLSDGNDKAPVAHNEFLIKFLLFITIC